MPAIEKDIFRRASTTYYWSSVFFPGSIRGDVFRLYSFVRVADDYVDATPQQRAKFKALRRAWDAAKGDLHADTMTQPADSLDQRVVKNMLYVTQKYAFDPAWVESFLDSMQADLDGKRYETLDDTLWYIHGSAEVIGLMMAKMMSLKPGAYEAAKLQGRAMQFINFIRDIHEDTARGRCYFPGEDLRKFGLADLSRSTVTAKPRAFERFVRFELERYKHWQAAAAEGFRYIPRRQRSAVRTAVDMYDWTAAAIAQRPFVVFDRQVKPHKRQVILRALRRSIG
jgi:phytoene synthase